MGKTWPKDYERYFLYTIYEERLNWTKKNIPISYIDPVSGFRLEGYIKTPPLKKEVVEIDGKKEKFYSDDVILSVKPAFLPIYSPSKVDISIKDILPSQREIECFDYDSLSLKKVESIKVKNTLYFYDYSDILQIYKHYPNIAWTKQELCKMGSASLEDIEKLIDNETLIKDKKRLCLIMADLVDTYKSAFPISDHKIENTIQDLSLQYADCSSCRLGKARKARGCPVVFGRGKVYKPELFIIGEAPGTLEEKHNITFYPEAPAGEVLHKVMNAAGFNQNNCYITNSVLCRPEPESNSKLQNGKPKAKDIEICNSRLKNELHIVSPYVVVLLGLYAYKAFFGEEIIGGLLKNIGWVDTDNPHYQYILNAASKLYC
jgi:uracil-DNA glycosylase family 4